MVAIKDSGIGGPMLSRGGGGCFPLPIAKLESLFGVRGGGRWWIDATPFSLSSIPMTYVGSLPR